MNKPGSEARLAESPSLVQNLLKRVCDVIVAVPLTILLAPVMVVIAIGIKAGSPGPIFFRQDRLGYRGRVFRIFKFRTMLDNSRNTEADLFLHQDDPRITPIGSMLRKYRLDELPQLLNVIRGEMSLVGPRPLLPEYLEAYSDDDRRRMNARPGMTGWQQVHGAATNTWEERIILDLWYVDHRSLLVDIKVLFLTIFVVFKTETVYGKDGIQRSGVPTRYLDNNGE